MLKTETAAGRTRAVLLDAAARVLGRRPDAAMSDIAEAAGVGRATLYRHFPTRDLLLHGVADAGTAELSDAFAAATLDDIPADRAISRIISIFLRTGAKYAALAGQLEEYGDPEAKECVVVPVHHALERGVRDGLLRPDVPREMLFEMLSALVERSLWLVIAGTVVPEVAADAVTQLFLDGARQRS